MAKFNNDAFVAAHPDLARDVSRKHGGLDWIKKYTHEEGGKIVEWWERNERGELVNVTQRELAREALERAQEEYEALLAQEAEDDDD